MAVHDIMFAAAGQQEVAGGRFVAVAITHIGGAYNQIGVLQIWMHDGDTMTFSQQLSYDFEVFTNGNTFSNDGVYLAQTFGYSTDWLSSALVKVYKKSGSTFAQIPTANFNYLPPSHCHSVSFSPDGAHMAVASSAAPYLIIYKRVGDTFTRITAITTPPTTSLNGVTYSPDGNYLLVTSDAASGESTQLFVRRGDTYTRQQSFGGEYGARSASCPIWSSDNKYFAITAENVPSGYQLIVFRQDGLSYTKLTFGTAFTSVIQASTDNQLAMTSGMTHIMMPGHVTANNTNMEVGKFNGTNVVSLLTPMGWNSTSFFGGFPAVSDDDAYVFHLANDGLRLIKRTGDTFNIVDTQTYSSIVDGGISCWPGVLHLPYTQPSSMQTRTYGAAVYENSSTMLNVQNCVYILDDGRLYTAGTAVLSGGTSPVSRDIRDALIGFASPLSAGSASNYQFRISLSGSATNVQTGIFRISSPSFSSYNVPFGSANSAITPQDTGWFNWTSNATAVFSIEIEGSSATSSTPHGNIDGTMNVQIRRISDSVVVANVNLVISVVMSLEF